MMDTLYWPILGWSWLGFRQNIAHLPLVVRTGLQDIFRLSDMADSGEHRQAMFSHSGLSAIT
jgi:hypothetical protein